MGSNRRRFLADGLDQFKEGLEKVGVVWLSSEPDWNQVTGFLDVSLGVDRLFSELPVQGLSGLRTFTDFRKSICRLPETPSRNVEWTFDSKGPPRGDPFADPRSAFPFRGGESDALAHLREYFSDQVRVKSYKATRNGMVGVDYSSKFSPFLSTGVLSVRRVWSEIEKFEALHGVSEGSEWLRFELLWREYFRWLESVHGAAFFSKRGIRDLQVMEVVPDQERFSKWTQGETGHAFIDANMKELLHTGFMSNRGRQNVASFLIHELQLPWWWGADYFSRMLIDSDPAQNYGNWSYLAGVGSDPRSFGGKPRKFDPNRQAEMYDPDGNFRKLWLTADSADSGPA